MPYDDRTRPPGAASAARRARAARGAVASPALLVLARSGATAVRPAVLRGL
jgi:hypothetical protein